MSMWFEGKLVNVHYIGVLLRCHASYISEIRIGDETKSVM